MKSESESESEVFLVFKFFCFWRSTGLQKVAFDGENPIIGIDFYHKHGGRWSIAGTAQHSMKPYLQEFPLNLTSQKMKSPSILQKKYL